MLILYAVNAKSVEFYGVRQFLNFVDLSRLGALWTISGLDPSRSMLNVPPWGSGSTVYKN